MEKKPFWPILVVSILLWVLIIMAVVALSGFATRYEQVVVDNVARGLDAYGLGFGGSPGVGAEFIRTINFRTEICDLIVLDCDGNNKLSRNEQERGGPDNRLAGLKGPQKSQRSGVY